MTKLLPHLLPNELPPWLQQPWSTLYARQQSGSVPHAMLIEGPTGIGKRDFARFVAHTLLCSDHSLQGACRRCASCALLGSGSHPDVSEIGPAGTSMVIKIDQIREMVDWLQLTPQYHSYKIAIVSPAEAMNRHAANSLLKTLEEPASNDLILLLAERRGLLPATIVSRCQRVNLTLRDRPAALTWLVEQGIDQPETALALAADGPLLAASQMQGELFKLRERLFKAWQDIVLGRASIARCVESVQSMPTRSCLQLMSDWVADITRLRADKNASIRHPDLRCALIALVSMLTAEQWFSLYDQLLHLYRTDSASVKTQAMLEGIFADIRLMQS